MRLLGKIALVTAAAQGIGHAVAQTFAAEGATVWAADVRGDLLTVDERTRPLTIDLTDRDAVAALPNTTGAVDILFNGVGYVHAGGILDCDDDAWARSFDLNVTTIYRTIRAYLPLMIARGGGSIINTASVASNIKGVPGRFAYGASKAAVIGMTKAVAADHVAQGVRCNAICPGTVDSPSLRDRIARQAETSGVSVEQANAAFVARQPIGRIGDPREIAALAVYLASDDSRFTTGTQQVIDGGWTN